MPQINSRIIKWARETVKLSLEEAAHKLNIKDSKKASAIEKLAAYEDGSKDPSRQLLLKMSKKYRQPLITFYLDRPPRIGDRGEDFRSLPDIFVDEDDSHISILIRDIKARQSIVREALIAESEDSKIDWVGKYSQEDGEEKIVSSIRETLDFKLSEFRDQANYKEGFKYLRSKVEAIGVFVLLKGNLGSHHSNIDISSFRGFVLSDEVAPFVVINDLDAESAWSFTLIHEIAHLFFGDTGISGQHAEIAKERFCNNVASELLLPEKELSSFHFSSYEFDSLKSSISDFSSSHMVSSSHVAYRLLRRGDISKSLWNQLSSFYRGEWLKQRKIKKAKDKEKDGGPSYYVVKRHRLGALAELARRLNYSGALSTSKAGFVLDIRPLKLHRLFQIV
jgi:Zn-dependent peptidase ImmA (M78 family)